MSTHSIDTSAESRLNKIPVYTSLRNNNHENNNLINEVSLIENNNISLEKISFISSPLKAMNSFLKKIKNQLLIQRLTQAPVDIELDRILSQGRILSGEGNVLHSLLNDKPDIPPASLSLTTKTGMVLGGLLLTSAIAGGGYLLFSAYRS